MATILTFELQENEKPYSPPERASQLHSSIKPELWIRIRIDLDLLDPDPTGSVNLDPGARKRKLSKTYNQPLKGFCTFVLVGIYVLYLIKVKLYEVRIRIEVKSWTWIRIETNADP
jgi:hypothetical protein